MTDAVYGVARAALLPPLDRGLRWTVEGAHLIPLHGPVILASNHVSYLDPLALAYVADRRFRRVRFLAKAELFDKAGLGWFLRAAGQIPVARGTSAAAGALDAAVAALRRGECVAVFPEGTISLDLNPMPGKSGTARLARASGAPVVPVGLWGAHRLLFKGRKPDWRLGVAETAVVGPCVRVEPDDDVREATDRIMSAICAQLARARELYPQRPSAPDDTWWDRPPETAVLRSARAARMRVAVVGAGSWGTTVAAIAATNADTMLWARDPVLAARIDQAHENPDYLPGIELPARLRASHAIDDVCSDADVVVLGVPSHGLRVVLESVCGSVGTDVPVVNLAKGIEQETIRRMTEVVGEVLVDHRPDRIGVLTGPNLAREVAEGQPTASVVAIGDPDTARELQRLFMTGTFRVYTNPDVVGCEIAGALKNVIALAAGIAHGLGYGDNTKAALVTRGLAELARLGIALGGDPLTFSGLAGMGDLVATCTSEKSRNRTVGVALGQGRSLDEVVAEMKMVAEGVKSTAAVLELARRHGVEMPIAEQVGAVLYEGRRPADIVPALMVREAKPELRGMR